jgi:hypothetical protein
VGNIPANHVEAIDEVDSILNIARRSSCIHVEPKDLTLLDQVGQLSLATENPSASQYSLSSDQPTFDGRSQNDDMFWPELMSKTDVSASFINKNTALDLSSFVLF